MAVTRIKNNQITDLTVNAAAKLQDYSITSGKIANNLTYGSDFTIAGNLTVQGNVTAIDTTDLVVEDPLIFLAKDQTGAPSLDIGFIGKRGDEENIAFVWDESADQFAAVFTSSEVTNTVISINTYASLQVLDLTANSLSITANISAGNLSVSSITATGNVDANNLIASTLLSTAELITSGDALVGGNLTVEGNLTYINIDDLRVEDPIIILGTGPNGAPLTSDDNKDRGIYMEYYTTGLGNAFVGWQNASGNMIIANDVEFSANDVVQVNSYGTINIGNAYAESATISGATNTDTLSVTGTSGLNFVVDGDSVSNVLVTDATSGTVLIKTGTPSTGVSLKINATDSMLLPIGNNAQRPGTPITGMLRFNTTIDTLEYYDSDSWENILSDFTVINADEFNGDGSTVQFTLSQDSTTAATLVSINGVVQLPTTAYSVSGNVLTFTEAPANTDVIDARTLTTTASITSLQNQNGTATITPNPTQPFTLVLGNIIPEIDDLYTLGNIDNRWAEGYFAANSLYVGNVRISEVGNVLSFFNVDGNAAVTAPTTAIENGTSNVTIPSSNGNITAHVGGNEKLAINSGGIAATGNVSASVHTYTGGAETWLADTGEDATGRLTLAVGNIDGALETVIVNRSAGNLAYGEFLAINDTGNITDGWISMGINSSTYDDPAYPITKADDGYILYTAPDGTSEAGNLVIGTGNTGAVNAIVFGAGGFATGNTQMVVFPDEKVEIVIPTTSTNTATGALVVDGGVGVTGNINVGGNVTLANTSTVTANNFFANQKVWSGPVESWLTAVGEVDSGRRIVAVANIAGPAETVQVNLSADTLAYSEFLAINDVGNMTSGWISMGINSSTYDDPSYQLTGADDGYLLFEAPTGTTGAGNLIIGTGGEGNVNAIVFGAGGFATGNTQMTIFPDVKVEIVIATESTSTGTGALVVDGGIGLTGNLNVGGDVNIVGNITLGGTGNTIDVSSLAVDDPIIYMGANNAADVLDLGFAGEYQLSGSATYAGLVRDATDGAFKFWANVQPRPTDTIDFADANLVYPAVFMGSANIQNSTASTNTGTGALIVAGGTGIGGAIYVGGLASITGNLVAGNLQTGGQASVTGNLGVQGTTELANVTTGNLTVGVGSDTVVEDIYVNNILNRIGNVQGNIGNSTSYFNTVFAKATSAQYADLAEMYTADALYEPGTVVSFGGNKEVTMSVVECDNRVAGVISTQPSYLMNATLESEHVAPVALQGRVPTKVVGPVRKGDMMVSNGNGAAMACSSPQVGTVIGKAIEDFDLVSGVIEIVIGRV